MSTIEKNPVLEKKVLKPKKWVEKPPVWIYKLLFLAL